MQLDGSLQRHLCQREDLRQRLKLIDTPVLLAAFNQRSLYHDGDILLVVQAGPKQAVQVGEIEMGDRLGQGVHPIEKDARTAVVTCW